MFFLSFTLLSFYGNLEWHVSEFGGLKIFQNIGRQYITSCLVTDDYWFSKKDTEEGGTCRRYYTERYTEGSQLESAGGFMVDSDTETVQFFGMEYICLALDKKIGYIFFDWDNSNVFDCEMYHLKGKKLTIDIKLFKPLPSSDHSIDPTRDYTIAENICLKLTSLFQSLAQRNALVYQKPLALLTGESSSKQRMELWLSYCNLSPVAVSLWQNSLSTKYNQHQEASECNVHRVRGLGRAPSKGRSGLDNLFHCIEDILGYLAEKDEEKGLVTFISTLNLPPSLDSRATELTDDSYHDDISDIYRVLRAAQYADGVRNIYITGLSASTTSPSPVTGNTISYAFVSGNINEDMDAKRITFRSTVGSILSSCLDAEESDIFLDSLENLLTVASGFLKDYTLMQANSRVLDLRCDMKEESCRRSVVERGRSMLSRILLEGMFDTGFIHSTSEGVMKLSCYAAPCVKNSGDCKIRNICRGELSPRRIILGQYLVRLVLPDREFLLRSGGAFSGDIHVTQALHMDIPDIMWSFSSEYVASFLESQQSDISVNKYQEQAASCDIKSMTHVSITNPDTVKLFNFISAMVQHERVYVLSHASPPSSLGSVMVWWADQFRESTRKRLVLPINDEFGSGPYVRNVELSCTPHEGIKSRFMETDVEFTTSSSMVFVLVFVSSDDEFAAVQSHVHEWKERERIRSNLYIRYFVVMTPPIVNDPMSQQEYSGGANLRYILLFLNQWISDFATHLDIVVSLNGIKGVRAFRAPRPSAGSRGRGITPYLQSDPESQYIHLFAPIVFSEKQISAAIDDDYEYKTSYCDIGSDFLEPSNFSSGCREEFDKIDMSAFAGAVFHLRPMLNHILKRDPLFGTRNLSSSFGGSSASTTSLDDDHVRCAIYRFAHHHPFLVGVDLERSYFDHNKATQDKPLKRSDAFSAIHKLSALAPTGHCNPHDNDKLVDSMLEGAVNGIYVNESKLMELDSRAFRGVLQGELCFPLRLTWGLFEKLRNTSHYWVPIARLYWQPIAMPMMAFNVSLIEKKAAIFFLQSKLNEIGDASSTDIPFRGIYRLLNLYISCIYQEIGPFHLAAKHLALSVDGALSSDIQHIRSVWADQRSGYKKYIAQQLSRTYSMSPNHGSIEEAAWMAPLGIVRNGQEVLSNYTGSEAHPQEALTSNPVGRSAEILRKPEIHVFTLATERRVYLDNLEFSAKIAGVKLKVVGMGHRWNGFAEKIPMYRQAILEDVSVDDNDVVFVVDGYDVLLFPAIRNAIKVFSDFPAPIMMCTEVGIHPEQLAGLLYRRGDDSSPSEFGYQFSSKYGPANRLARFINSGCVAGRAAQIKALFGSDDQWPHVYFRDDQMDQGRFLLSNPHHAAIDDSRQLMFSAYKENVNMVVGVDFDFGLRTNRHNRRSIGVLHCNGGSLSVCEKAFEAMKGVYDQFYAGGTADSEKLLAAMRHIWEGDLYRASQIIESMGNVPEKTERVALSLNNFTDAEIDKKISIKISLRKFLSKDLLQTIQARLMDHDSTGYTV